MRGGGVILVGLDPTIHLDGFPYVFGSPSVPLYAYLDPHPLYPVLGFPICMLRSPVLVSPYMLTSIPSTQSLGSLYACLDPQSLCPHICLLPSPPPSPWVSYMHAVLGRSLGLYGPCTVLVFLYGPCVPIIMVLGTPIMYGPWVPLYGPWGPLYGLWVPLHGPWVPLYGPWGPLYGPWGPLYGRVPLYGSLGSPTRSLGSPLRSLGPLYRPWVPLYRP
jgi:hypothetical protein